MSDVEFIPTDLEDRIKAKLQKDSLSTDEVIEGMRECFVNTHRTFLKRRRPNYSIQQIDTLSNELIEEVMVEELFLPEKANAPLLRELTVTLDERFGFAEDPELKQQHGMVVHMMIDRLGT